MAAMLMGGGLMGNPLSGDFFPFAGFTKIIYIFPFCFLPTKYASRLNKYQEINYLKKV